MTFINGKKNDHYIMELFIRPITLDLKNYENKNQKEINKLINLFVNMKILF